MNIEEVKHYLKYGEPPIPKYEIAYGTYMDQLVERVNEMIQHGWEPVGGVQSTGVESILWTQAMIKR